MPNLSFIAGPREAAARVRWIEVGVFVATLALVGGAGAADSVERSWSAASPGGAIAFGAAAVMRAPVRPWIHPSMPNGIREKLEEGFVLAVQRVREVESCGDLFSRLGADPLETLAAALYFPVDSYWREVNVCGRGSEAGPAVARNLVYTRVGGTPTWICRHFDRVSVSTAAMAVIHEALHHAGLNEWPRDRTAMTSIEITRMVRDACGF